jgi:hypothetical protein
LGHLELAFEGLRLVRASTNSPLICALFSCVVDVVEVVGCVVPVVLLEPVVIWVVFTRTSSYPRTSMKAPLLLTSAPPAVAVTFTVT